MCIVIIHYQASHEKGAVAGGDDDEPQSCYENKGGRTGSRAGRSRPQRQCRGMRQKDKASMKDSNNDDDGDETEHGSVNVPGDGLSEGLGSGGAMMTKVTKVIYCAEQP